MATNPAPGGPGLEPHWTTSAKDAVGTAYALSSNLWYTLSDGIINEIYYPTIDRPQVRDVQLLVTDGETFFHDEARNTVSAVECLTEKSLGLRVTNVDPDGRYRIIKEIISDPHQPCLLQRITLEAADGWEGRLRLFVLCAPHIDVGGWGDQGEVVEVQGQKVMVAADGGVWMAMASSPPILRCSCGYVGTNDGWTDLAENFQLDHAFDAAGPGNIALTAELDLSHDNTVTVAIALEDRHHAVLTSLFQSLGIPFDKHRSNYLEQWDWACRNLHALHDASCDGGVLYHRSQSLLLGHEDKIYSGALIASLSIPWGEVRTDEDAKGGYHLVWTRDMVQSTTGLLATGNVETPHRSLIYLACSQLPDGGFHQNFWVSGEPYFLGVQLDEVAFPILLAWRLATMNALQEIDPLPMVQQAARYLIAKGPATPQERWEENSGYSPSTLAANIAGLTCAAVMVRERGDTATADFIQDYADFLESHVEAWTVTTQGTLLSGIPRHYIRIHPVALDQVTPNEDPNSGMIHIANRHPSQLSDFPACDVVDGGFLELVRYGIRKAGDALIEDTLQVIDAVLKIDTPYGPCWRRYNHDGYGQRDNGDAYDSWGRGRPWPLLTGERGHYELAAGRSPEPYIRAMEAFSHGIGLIPEQIWDQPDIPEKRLYFGRPTGAAMPLCWGHAEYIKLLRSTSDAQVFDFLPHVAERYISGEPRQPIEIWKFNRQIRTIPPGVRFRIQAEDTFTLRWTMNNWETYTDTPSTSTAIAIDFADILLANDAHGEISFTFKWGDRWEERNYEIIINN